MSILIEEEANIKEKLMQIQSSISPHLEVLHKEQAYTKTILKKDSNLSTLDALVHLSSKTTIKHKSLDFALENWDVALKMIMEVNSTFLAKYGLNL